MRRDQKGGLGWVALDLPLAIVEVQLRVVGHRSADEDTLRLQQRRRKLGVPGILVADTWTPVSVTSTSPEAVTTLVSVISFLVRVPVLSEQMTEARPSVSTECRSFMTALRRAIPRTPMASTSERIAGRPSGTAATARDSPRSNTVTMSCGVLTPLTHTMAAMTTTAIPTTMMPSDLETAATSDCNGDGSASVRSSRSAMRPISVSMPVLTTTARPTPCTMAVPR